MATKKNEIEILEKKKEQYLDKYRNAIDKCESSMWGLARTVYQTVKAPDFVKVFGKIDNYAQELNVSVSSISKMVKSFERYQFVLEHDGERNQLTVGQYSEMSKVPVEETIIFCDEYGINVDSTIAEVRTAYKEWLQSETTDTGKADDWLQAETTDAVADTADDGEQADTADDGEQDEIVMTILYGDTEYSVSDEIVAKKILKILSK